MSLQFQDITKQEIEKALIPLQRIVRLSQDLIVSTRVHGNQTDTKAKRTEANQDSPRIQIVPTPSEDVPPAVQSKGETETADEQKNDDIKKASGGDVIMF